MELTIKMSTKTDNNTVLAFSKDGIYWVYMIVDRANGQGVSEVGDEILIQKDYGTYYVGDKEKYFHSCVKNCRITLFM